MIGVRRRGFGGGRDALDQCAVGLDHHGPGSRAMPESNTCASGVLVDACLGDAGNDALAHLRLECLGRESELGREQLGVDGDLAVCEVIADAGTGLIAMRPW